MQGLTEGRIVHYVLKNGEHRPAIVVKVWQNEYGTDVPGVNLIVFIDGSNDEWQVGTNFKGDVTPFFWATSIKFDLETKESGTCHWIEPA